jgi:hypothetical protein
VGDINGLVSALPAMGCIVVREYKSRLRDQGESTTLADLQLAIHIGYNRYWVAASIGACDEED